MQRLISAGQWQPGDTDIWIVADAGYDGPRLALLLQDLPVKVVVRMRSDKPSDQHDQEDDLDHPSTLILIALALAGAVLLGDRREL